MMWLWVACTLPPLDTGLPAACSGLDATQLATALTCAEPARESCTPLTADGRAWVAVECGYDPDCVARATALYDAWLGADADYACLETWDPW
jgi:hypothetical protein